MGLEVDYTELDDFDFRSFGLDKIELSKNFSTDYNFKSEIDSRIEKEVLYDVFFTVDVVPKYEKYFDQLTVDDYPIEGDNGNLFVRCKFCKEYFQPSFSQIYMRSYALRGMFSQGTENNFYCSKECKKKCPTYRSQGGTNKKYLRDPNYVKQLKDFALEIAEYKCEICGSEEKLEVHHIIPVKVSPIEIYDIDNVVVLCRECHKEIGHSQEGCRLQDIRNCTK